jgi:flavin-dependent dehydrogenase
MGTPCKSAVINKIRRFELFADGRVASVPLHWPDLVIDRPRLIQGLLSLAEKSGVEVLTGNRFMSVKPHGRKLAFTVSRNDNGRQVEETAEILVGADGAFSTVAESAGWPARQTVPLFQAVVELPKDMPPDATRLWFVPEDTPYFYWLIPHGPTQGVLGLIGEQGQDIRISLERFLEKKGLVPVEFQCAQVPRYTGWIPVHRRVGEGHVYLVGDAVNHVKASTMGGVITGFRGALGVAEAILNGGIRPEFRVLRRELDIHLLIRKVLSRFSQGDYARLLDLITPSVKHSLGLFNRDESRRLLVHVFLKQPRLLLLSLRSLLVGA